jgi:hypothetical protein
MMCTAIGKVPNYLLRDHNTQEIVKLVELVLGVMVESEHKNEYIGNIMKLDEATQRELMVILEGVCKNKKRKKKRGEGGIVG